MNIEIAFVGGVLFVGLAYFIYTRIQKSKNKGTGAGTGGGGGGSRKTK